MQAQVSRTEAKTGTISSTQSLAAIQTLLRAGLGCITFMRDLLPQDNFTESHFTTSDDSMSSNSTFSSPEKAKKNVNGFKIMTMARGYTDEADKILNYLEYGIFDALQKQYLKSFIFAIYLNNKDPNNIVEAYTFNFHYHKIAGTDTVVPIMSLGDELQRMTIQGKDPVVEATKKGAIPTLKDVKRSVKTLLKTLITSMTQMDVLPKRRYATFKVFYTDETPSNYEPPHFEPGEYERDKWYFATHDLEEIPDSWSVGKVNAGWHEVDVKVSSIATYLPSSTENDNLAFAGTVSRTGVAAPPHLTPAEEVAQRNEETRKQSEDAQARRVVWAVEGEQTTPAESDADSNRPNLVRKPIGIKDDDGIIRDLDSMNVEEPTGERHYYGTSQHLPRTLKDIKNRMNLTPDPAFPQTQLLNDTDDRSEYGEAWKQVPARDMRRQISDAFSMGGDSEMETGTPCPTRTKSGRLAVGAPSLAPANASPAGSPPSSPRGQGQGKRVDSIEMGAPEDEDGNMKTNELMKELALDRDAEADEIEDEEMLDLETQAQVDIHPEMLYARPVDSPIQSFDSNRTPPLPKDVTYVPSSPAAQTSAPVAKALRRKTDGDEVECECGIKEEDECCACEGPCGKWYHIWCMGYHSTKDPRLPDHFVCFDCRVHADPSWELIKVELYSTMVGKFRELASFRRAIKVAEKDSPLTAVEFAQAMGCENTQARQLIKRLETEGFIAEESTTTDEIGFMRTRTKSGRGKGKTKQTKARKGRGLQKQKFAFNPQAIQTQEYKDYFDPRPEVESRLLGISQMRASLKAAKVATMPTLPPSDPPELGSFSQTQTARTQSETQTQDDEVESFALGQGLKRSAESYTDDGPNPRKKIKISIVNGVDLAE